MLVYHKLKEKRGTITPCRPSQSQMGSVQEAEASRPQKRLLQGISERDAAPGAGGRLLLRQYSLAAAAAGYCFQREPAAAGGGGEQADPPSCTLACLVAPTPTPTRANCDDPCEVQYVGGLCPIHLPSLTTRPGPAKASGKWHAGRASLVACGGSSLACVRWSLHACVLV